jgi:hypothetical protein
VAVEESFEQDGAWIRSFKAFKVRALGRSGMEYVSGTLILRLDTEALPTPAFVLNPRTLPDDTRDRVIEDVTRAWRWSGFEIQVAGPFEWGSVAVRPPQD